MIFYASWELWKYYAVLFALSDAENNTSKPGFLCWENYQQFAKSSESEVSRKWQNLVLCRFPASRTLLQWLLSYCNFPLDSEDLFCWYKGKKWFLWTMVAAKQLATMNEWMKEWMNDEWMTEYKTNMQYYYCK